MHNSFRGLAMLTVLAVIGMLALSAHAPTSAQTAEVGDAAQGQYIVTVVARCTSCHSADLSGRPPDPANPNRPPTPKIAGLPMFNRDADAVKFLETATLPEGFPKLSPAMPPYKLKHSDALAVVAYLKSLKAP
jgi:mono/diheme cytochrome c family protein